MAAALWPRLRLWAIAWVVLVTGLLELGGLHVPSDIAGGLLAGGALVAAAAAACAGRPGPRQRPLQSGGHAAPQAPRPADLEAPPGAADARGR
jgi:membrane-associated phospholipid phosphatase